MHMLEKMMGLMMGRMSKEDKDAMMGQMMDKFFDGMTADDKSKLMADMMPKMMQGIDMTEMMPKMMMGMMGGGEGKGGMMGMMPGVKEGGHAAEMPMMPQMMMKMMPHCITVILPNISKEKRVAFVSEMVAKLVEEGASGMTEEEKKNFQEMLMEKMKG